MEADHTLASSMSLLRSFSPALVELLSRDPEIQASSSLREAATFAPTAGDHRSNSEVLDSYRLNALRPHGVLRGGREQYFLVKRDHF